MAIYEKLPIYAVELDNKSIPLVCDNVVDFNTHVCRVVDYNGEVLKEQLLTSGEVFELPTPPVHDGLIFKEWSSPVEISNNNVVVENSDLIFGATYTTESGKNEFDVVLDETTGLTVMLNMTGTKDWGDGTTDATTSHVYSGYGSYTITCDGMSFGSYGLLDQILESAENYYYKEIRLAEGVTTIGGYCLSDLRALIAISLPNTISTIDASAFDYCRSLKSLIVPNGVTSLGGSVASGCWSIDNVVLPRTITTISSRAFDELYSITHVTIPNGVTTLDSYCFKDCKGLRKITIPAAVTQILNDAFSKCSSVVVYDFSTHTTVPTLKSRTVFTNAGYLITGKTKIVVPDALYDSWIIAKWWSDYADCIYKVSDVRS